VLADRVKSAWAEGKPAIIRAGQRSGKKTLVAELLRGFHVGTIIAKNPNSASEGFQHLRLGTTMFMTPNDAWRRLIHNAGAYANEVVVLHEPWWWNLPARALLIGALVGAGAKVLVIGSNSDLPDKRAWDVYPEGYEVWHYNTWDLNPTLPRDGEVLLAEYAKDPKAAARDFEG
jgi:hypothetical protein